MKLSNIENPRQQLSTNYPDSILPQLPPVGSLDGLYNQSTSRAQSITQLWGIFQPNTPSHPVEETGNTNSSTLSTHQDTATGKESSLR
jgi:hypothetical protein